MPLFLVNKLNNFGLKKVNLFKIIISWFSSKKDLTTSINGVLLKIAFL